MTTPHDKTEKLFGEISKINEELAKIGADADFFSNVQRGGGGGFNLPRNCMDKNDFNKRLEMLEGYLAKYTEEEAKHQNAVDKVKAAILELSKQNALLLHENKDHMLSHLESQKKEAERKLVEASCSAFQQKLAIHYHWANYKPIDAAQFRKLCSALIDKKIAVYKAANSST